MSSPVLARVEEALVEHFGHRPQRASTTFLGLEPIEVLRFEPIPGERAYVTLGMARHPMTGADAAVLANDGPRAELALHLRDPSDARADVWRRLAVLAAAPAVEGVVYAPGMSVDLGQPLVAGSACTGVIVDESPIGSPIASPIGSPIGSVRTQAGEVRILQVTPATSGELAWCRVRGCGALRERWTGQQVDLLDLLRAPAKLG